MDRQTSRLVHIITLVLGLAGIGFLGAVDAVGRVEARPEDLLLTFTVATTHRLDDVIQARFSFFLILHT